MSEVVRQAQKIEVSFKKTIHLCDYENEEYSGSLTATFNRGLTQEEGAVEIAKLQAELEYAVFYALYVRKAITTHDFKVRVDALVAHLTQLGVSDAANYLKGGVHIE